MSLVCVRPSLWSSVLICAAIVVSACGGAIQATLSPPSPTGTAVTEPGDLAAWVLFRQVYGLRSDIEWIEQVLADPSRVGAELGVPLLPSELEAVSDANSDAIQLLPLVRGYGARHADSFAGAWIEGPMVILALANSDASQVAEVVALFGRRVGVRSAPHSLRDLGEQVGRVNADRPWFRSIGVELRDVEIDEPSNGVRLWYRATDRGIEAAIRARYANPDWLQFAYDGPPPWTGPRGDIALTVVDRDGHAVPVECLLGSADPRVWHEDIVNAVDGTCVFRMVPAVQWSIEVTYGDTPRTVRQTLVVRPGGTAKATLVVEP